MNGEAHSNVSGFSDRTLAECFKSILPNFQNDTEATMWGTILYQADISVGVRRIDLGKSTTLTALKAVNISIANISSEI